VNLHLRLALDGCTNTKRFLHQESKHFISGVTDSSSGYFKH